jgi:hypothetical protein
MKKSFYILAVCFFGSLFAACPEYYSEIDVGTAFRVVKNSDACPSGYAEIMTKTHLPAPAHTSDARGIYQAPVCAPPSAM